MDHLSYHVEVPETRRKIQGKILEVDPGKIYRVREVTKNLYSHTSFVFPVIFQEDRDLFLELLDDSLRDERKIPLIPTEGVSCCAIDNGKWCRVLIKKVHTGGSALAEFIDYGWSKNLSSTSFFETPYCLDIFEPLVLCVKFKDTKSVYEILDTEEYFVEFLKWERDTKHWIVDYMGIPVDVERGTSYKFRAAMSQIAEQDRNIDEQSDYSEFLNRFPSDLAKELNFLSDTVEDASAGINGDNHTSKVEYIDSDIENILLSAPGCSYVPNSSTSGLAETLLATKKENNNRSKDTYASPLNFHCPKAPKPIHYTDMRYRLDEIIFRSGVRWDFFIIGPSQASVFFEFTLPPPIPFNICGNLHSVSERHCTRFIPHKVVPALRQLLITVFAIGVHKQAVIILNSQNESVPPMFGRIWNNFPWNPLISAPKTNNADDIGSSSDDDSVGQMTASSSDDDSVGQTTATPIRALSRELMKSEERPPSTSPVGSSLWKEPIITVDPVPSTDIPESEYGQPLIEQPSSSSFPNKRWAIPNTRGEKSSLNRDHANSSNNGNPSFHSPDSSSTVTYHNPTPGFPLVWDPPFVTPPVINQSDDFTDPPEAFDRFSSTNESSQPPSVSMAHTSASFPQTSAMFPPTICSFTQFLSSLNLDLGDLCLIPNPQTYFSPTPESNSDGLGWATD